LSGNLSQLAKNPIFFERNRVFRVYTGGKLFHEFFGDANEDGFLPEEWIASSVRALNRDSTNQYEGVSKIRDTDVYLNDLMESQHELMLGNRENFGILVKILDSAVRLPVQAHPDKEFSRKYFHSEFGKAEAWIVLATREDAKIYFGFNGAMSKERFLDAVERSETEKDAMEELLNVIPAKPGDVYFIPPNAVHAIGYGCLILEVQEPTDFTIQPEAWCGDYKLNDYEKYLGLDKSTALDCFDYSVFGEASVALGRKTPKLLKNEPGMVSESLIGSDDTSCFALNRHKIDGAQLQELSAPAVYIVTSGEGQLFGADGYSNKLKKGDYFFLPACIDKKCSVSGNALELVECLPPNSAVI